MKKLIIVLGSVFTILLLVLLWRLSIAEDEVFSTNERGRISEESATIPRRSGRDDDDVDDSIDARTHESSAISDGEAQAVAEGPNSFTVHVQTASGDSIEGAAVYLVKPAKQQVSGFDFFGLLNQVFKSGDAQASGVTDQSGQCFFRGLPSGRYQAAVFKDGYEALYSKVVSIRDAIEPMPVRVRLHRGHELQGTVVDSDKQPIEGAVVAVLPEMQDVPENLQTLKQMTDAKGHFLFATLAERDHHIMVSASGFATMGLDGVETGKKNHVITLKKGGTVRGRVIDETTGKGISGASVAFLIDRSFELTESGEDGEYEAGNVTSDETISVIVKAEGFSISAGSGKRSKFGGSVKLQEKVKVGGVIQKDILMAPLGILRGRVVDARTSTPLVGVRVRTMLDGFMQGTGASEALTDESGYYSLSAEGVGLSVIATRKGYQSEIIGPLKGRRRGEAVGFSVVSGRETVVPDILLRAGRAIHGVVVDTNGQPVARAAVSMVELNVKTIERFLGTSGQSTPTDADGAFELTGLPEKGDIELKARHPFFPAGGVVTVSDESETIEGVRVVIAAGGSIKGKILDFNSEPLGGVTVLWRSVTAHAEKSESHRVRLSASAGQFARSDASGQFLLAGVQPGSVLLALDPSANQRMAESDVTVTVVDGQDTSVTLRCVQLLEISGIVVDENGKPVSRATVTAKGPSSETVRSRRNGRFRIPNLTTGAYQLQANRRGRNNSETVSAIAGSSGTVLTLSRKRD